MRKLALLVVPLVLVVAVVASAQQRRADGKWHVGTKDTPIAIDGVLYVNQTLNNGGVGGCDGGPGICFTGKGVLVYDFPSIPPTGAGSGCQDSSTGTATGCAFGDTVTLGIDQTLPANLNAAPPVAYVSAADSFKVRICNNSSDGGSIDFPDASFAVRCFR